jgi:hypothetical protein
VRGDYYANALKHSYYTGMVSAETNHTGTHKYGGDSDVSSYCAFSFPAVLQTVGSARWGELSDTYLYIS